MLQAFKQELRLNRKDNWMMLAFLGGGFLVGFVILCAVLGFAGEERWFPMGTLMGGMAIIISAIVCDGLGLKQRYMVALSMGRTRKPQLAAAMLTAVLRAAAALLVIWPVSRLDLALYSILFRANGMESGVSEFLLRYITPKYLLIGILPIVCIGFLIAAVQGKFGKKGGIAIYFAFLACCIGLPRMIEFAQNRPHSIFGRLLTAMTALPLAAWVAIAVLLLLLILTVSVRILFRLRVELD